MTGWDRACGTGLGGAHIGLAEDRPASVLGLEEAELSALPLRCFLSLGPNTWMAGRSGVRASDEWLEGPRCMGDGAGGAKGDGLYSAAFIAALLSRAIALQINVNSSAS